MAVTSMHAASREALAAAAHRLDGVLSGDGADAKTVGAELNAFARVLGSDVSLRRALADPSATEDARKGLARALAEGKLGEPTLQVLDTLVTSRWSNPRELADGVRMLAADALLAAAEQDGSLETVERELFDVARVLGGTPELDQAMSDQTGTPEAKRELVQGVFGGKVNPVTQELVEQVAAQPRGRGVQHGLDELAELAAKRRDRSVAHVTTAAPLSDEQREALAERLNRIYGRPIVVHVEVKPAVLGGIVVKVGDEVIDGSSAGRIMALRGQLAG
jgi:F-type H+-transporting ATPase subunit delta